MALVNELQYHRNNNGIGAPKYVSSRLLTATVAENITIPEDADGRPARYVLFSSAGDFYVKYDGTAATVPGDIDDGTASEYKPNNVRYIGDVAGTTLSIVSAGTPIVTAAFFM